MNIKKVSMLGFKSFMERLEIHFPAGISAIVGPNGCGKSNIVDAIRWAMGEQSAKLLRGRCMEDVIFNGSNTHKPFGMAEVSIVFENGNGSFPQQFANETEVSVTRRLYRSGESEYLINGVPCRLKDIQEMFMDTGLGNRAYSIIGQGQITSIIEQKPEDTRAMLEEAAGVTKYKKKVEESRRKIEATKANLQRLEDILAEVQRQMRSLKRQAAKARRYKAIGKEIKRLELIIHSNTYHELKKESGYRIKSTEDLVNEEISRATEISKIQALIENMNLELEERDRKLSLLRQDYLRAKEKVGKKETALESMAAEKRMQEQLEKHLEKEKEELRERVKELEKEKEELLGKIEEAKKAASALEGEVELQATRVKNRQELLKQVREAYDEARNRVNSGASRESSLAQESSYLSKRIQEITDSKSRLEREREGVRLKIGRILQASERARDLREALARNFEKIEERIVHENETMNTLAERLEELQAEFKSIEAQLNTDQTRLASLHSLIENFEGYKTGVRAIMKANDLEPKRTGRIMGLVADIIDVDPKYELAVEAVLADKLQYVIVETQEDGKEAIDYLKLRARGRSSFVPVKDINCANGAGSQNGFPLLKDFVRVKSPYRPLVDVLLGNAAVVEDLSKAISAWAENGKDQCLVTPEGDIVEKSGILSGGKVAHTSHGILARKREIKHLQEKVSRQKTEMEELKQKLEALSAEKEKVKEKVESLVDEKFECQEKINDVDKRNFQLGHEIDQLEKLSERISQEIKQKEKEHKRQAEALNKVESELVLCQERKKQEEIYLREKETELKETEKEFEQYRGELAKLEMDLGLLREGRRGLLREVERIEDFGREAQKRSRRIDEDIVRTREKQQYYVMQKESMEEELEELRDRLLRSEKTLSMADQERNEFRNKILEKERQTDALRKELESLREEIHNAKMEQSEISFKMDGLVEIVKEKYNEDLAQIYKDYLVEDFSAPDAKEKLEHQRRLREKLGEVNLTAIQEHEALKERHAFITEQRQDLLDSIDSLNEAIRKINKTSLEKFMDTFRKVDEKLKVVFPILFNGGTAGLKLMDESRPLESGVLVQVQPPGKRLSHMGLLSGGEKALVAMALLFAIYLIKPSPFCLLDEVDAPLDDANIDRFNELLKEIKKYSQIILITHNRRSMEIVDRLFGVTMEKKGVSKMVSVNLEGVRNN